MSLAITEEHRALAETASSFLAKREALTQARKLLDAPSGERPDLWDELVSLGARITIADINPAAADAVRARHPEVAVTSHEEILFIDCDVVAPCALGAAFDAESIPRLRTEIVAGSANNQLATDADDQRLADAGILYVPDYVANAGGVINIAEETSGYDRERAWDRIAGIKTTVETVLSLAKSSGTAPGAAADAYAEARIAAVGGLAKLRTRG